jgi:regulator of sigma E protease
VVLDVAASDTGSGGGLAVLRQPEVLQIVVVPQSAGAGQPARMGVQISTPSVPVKYGLLAGSVHGVRFTGTILHAMLTALARMVTGRASVQLAGPVGISIMSRQMGEQGLVPFLEFVALLSLNLGLINLLPIPALDGGRLIFILAEAVRGKRVEPAREAVVHLIGFVAVIALMGVLTLLEVARLTGITKP